MSAAPTAPTPPPQPVAPAAHPRRTAVLAAAATSLEWYDFFIYATAAALVFNTTFFATDDAVVAALSSFATVAVGFVARPLGGVLAGHFGDRLGRKPVLVASTGLMALATTAIGLVPMTAVIWLAPALLVTLRICQGLSVGAQWGGAVLVATETAPAHRRGLYGSFAQLGVPLGVVLGNFAFLAVSTFVEGEDFMSWGWRIPFWASLVMVPLTLLLHRRLEETPAFRQVEQRMATTEAPPRSPLWQVVRRNPGTVLMAAFANVMGSMFFYMLITGSVQVITTYRGLDRSDVLGVLLAACVLLAVCIPLFGWLSDLIGRIRVFALGLAAMLVWSVPMWMLIVATEPGRLWPFVVAALVGAVAMSLTAGTQGTMLAELFPAEVRFSGASLGYQISAIIGGFAPMIMVAILAGDPANGWKVGLFLVAVAAAALLSLFGLHRRYAPQEVTPTG